LTDDSRAKIKAGVATVEAQLADGRDWLMGEFSIADLESTGWNMGTVALVPDAFDGFPLAAAWQQRVLARPSVQRALALATVPDPEKSWAPGPEINRWG
jgi:GST-like protein